MTAVTPSLVALEAQLRRSLQASKNDVGLLLQLSALLASSERSSEAEPFARKACALAPQHPQPPYSYGLILRDLGRWTEAESALSRSIALDPSCGYIPRACRPSIARSNSPAPIPMPGPPRVISASNRRGMPTR